MIKKSNASGIQLYKHIASLNYDYLFSSRVDESNNSYPFNRLFVPDGYEFLKSDRKYYRLEKLSREKDRTHIENYNELKLAVRNYYWEHMEDEDQ
jgi:hypothetical protein